MNEDVTRRDTVWMAAGAGITGGAAANPLGQQQLVERDVEIKTADGTCDAAFNSRVRVDGSNSSCSSARVVAAWSCEGT